MAALAERVTPDDQYRITFVARDGAADRARLERALATTYAPPNRAMLQPQLLGRFLAAQQNDRAEALVKQTRDDVPRADTTANAVYNLDVYNLHAEGLDTGRACFEEAMGGFPESHWATLAKQRLGVNPEAAPVAK